MIHYNRHTSSFLCNKVYDDLLSELDKGNTVLFGMRDLSAAFDIVDNLILLKRVESTFKIWRLEYSVDLFLSQGKDSRRKIFKPVILDCSLPQGSQMGPKRYRDYVFPLGKVILTLLLLYYCYADDTHVGKSCIP